MAKSETELEMEEMARRERARQMRDDIKEAIWIHEQQHHSKEVKGLRCKRCDVELEELEAVLLNKKLEDMKPGSEFYWIMLWGGEVRKYIPFECPKCRELSFFRTEEK